MEHSEPVEIRVGPQTIIEVYVEREAPGDSGAAAQDVAAWEASLRERKRRASRRRAVWGRLAGAAALAAAAAGLWWLWGGM